MDGVMGMNHYKLKCLATGREFADDGWMLANAASPRPALLRAEYECRDFRPRGELPGLFRYSDWLPVRREVPGASVPVTWRSRELGARLGLSRLYITFSGYWPEKGARMATGTFKECEAYCVCARLPENSGRVLVVASAGNTARAFLKVASDAGIPLLAVVPEQCLGDIWSPGELNPCVRVVAAGGDSDYFDAIALADAICKFEGFASEGGAKNVARRDGMGTTVLSAAEAAGAIPDWYFQAVGSGTGAIAAHEACLRLSASGRFEPKRMRLVVSQNSPFLPIYEAWREGMAQTSDMDAEEARAKMRCIDAKVLSNRKPPYGITGGLFDALKASGGGVDAVTNEEARRARNLFRDTEGCDIGAEAGVALASLQRRVRAGQIDGDALVMLNVTGGGFERIREAGLVRAVKPDAVFTREEFSGSRLKKYLEGIRNELLE